jgi:hypothetical protein
MRKAQAVALAPVARPVAAERRVPVVLAVLAEPAAVHAAAQLRAATR